MPRNRVLAAAPGLPSAILREIHDSLVLVLDALEGVSYRQPEREACRLLGEARA